ncbi:MAG: glycosyltransferase family 2 protein [Rhodanobacteraceae bacterium]|nr:glycosyltransferase family 2 protein [Rhodanobacteraceae bacterium]
MSVVMPLYNKADLVLEAIASVQAQEMTDWELVVVDDGSVDAGPEQVLAAAMQDARIRVVTQANQGVSVARNAGLHHAAADVVAFLDADDVWRPGFLAAVAALRERYPTARWWATGYALHREGRGGVARVEAARSDRRPESLVELFHHRSAIRPAGVQFSGRHRPISDTCFGRISQGIASGEDLMTWARLALTHPLATTAAHWRSSVSRGSNADLIRRRRRSGARHLQHEHPDTRRPRRLSCGMAPHACSDVAALRSDGSSPK